MRDLPDELRGFLEKTRTLIRDAVEKSYPASAVTLEALRKQNPALAKTVFVESVIEPAKRTLGKYFTDEAAQRLEDLESRLYQEPIANLYFAAETIVSSRMLHGIWESCIPDMEKLKQGECDAAGNVTRFSYWLVYSISCDIAGMLGELAALRERRVQILLATALLGKEAMAEAMEKYGGYQRGAVLQSVYQWLGIQNISEGLKNAIMKALDEDMPEETLINFHQEIMGNAFLGEDEVQRLAFELLNLEEEIPF